MPVDRGEIDVQLREIGEGERWWEQREFRELPHILHADERIRGITTGMVLGRWTPRLRPAGPWLILATDQRVLCLKQERFARKQVDIPAGQITRVRQSNRLRRYQITIETPRARYRLRIPKEDAFRFAGALAPLTPELAQGPVVRRLNPELEALAWLPGITTVAALPGFSGIVSRVAMLSPPDPGPGVGYQQLIATVETLQNDVERLQQQVAFLEDLLQQRAEQGIGVTVTPG